MNLKLTNADDPTLPEEVTDRLQADLKRLHAAPAPNADSVAPPRAHAIIRQRRRLRRLTPLAAAAAIALAALVWQFAPTSSIPQSAPPAALAAGISPDLNNDGVVDILDALVLRNQLDAGTAILDLTGDGSSTPDDAAALTARIVSLSPTDHGAQG